MAALHDVDAGQLVHGPSVLSQLSQPLRMWTDEGGGVVVHTPTYDGFRKAVTGLGREPRGVPGGDDEALRRVLVERERVAIMGGAVYGAPRAVRLNVGCPRGKAEAGVEALVRAVGAAR